ncbi:MAG: SMC-Scp complex subunit ScpB [Nitrospinae bacterium]|nr:SMC-Scp complex subunit ScpB [Nitrospinota bacterium]MBL7021108.1 SMC-Scp complex subunit ScpB [Nitrospinaceae bacterium]
MEREELKSIVENVLLAADQPINAGELCKIFLDGTDKDQLQSILDELKDEYNSRNLQITEVADGYQLSTRHEYNDFIRKFLKLDRSARLSQPSLDTLSIIAYKQPLTRQEVDEIRGVDSSGVIKTLLEKKVVGPAGRKKVPGRPIMYRTTQKFLEYFGLKDLSDLPTLEDLREELEGEDPPLQTQIEFLASEASEVSTSEAEPDTENH